MRIGAELSGVAAVRAEMMRIGTLPARALTSAAIAVEDYAEGEAAKHNKRGNLVRSLQRQADGPAWVIGHDGQHAPYAPFVHWGTKPHDIKPSKKKALRWAAGGRFAFAKVIHHPGYRGDPYFTRAAAQAPAIFERHLTAYIARGA